MDAKTAEIMYQRWVQVIQDWNNSGLSKRDYCQQNEIDEKQFYYYQRRIRAIIATQAERPALPEGSSGLAANSAGQQSNRPQIVKLQFPGMGQANASMISFSVNGMNFSVPEAIPASFLAKLLEAASHGSR
jgi:putative transposase